MQQITKCNEFAQSFHSIFSSLFFQLSHLCCSLFHILWPHFSYFCEYKFCAYVCRFSTLFSLNWKKKLFNDFGYMRWMWYHMRCHTTLESKTEKKKRSRQNDSKKITKYMLKQVNVAALLHLLLQLHTIFMWCWIKVCLLCTLHMCAILLHLIWSMHEQQATVVCSLVQWFIRALFLTFDFQINVRNRSLPKNEIQNVICICIRDRKFVSNFEFKAKVVRFRISLYILSQNLGQPFRKSTSFLHSWKRQSPPSRHQTYATPSFSICDWSTAMVEHGSILRTLLKRSQKSSSTSTWLVIYCAKRLHTLLT